MDSTLARMLSPAALTAYLVPLAWRIFTAVVVLILGIIALRVISSMVHRIVERGIRDPTVRSYITRTTRILLWIILFVILLGVVGVQTTSIVTMIGAAGLAIGLALQGSLSNIAAGVMLLLIRPFRSGDDVEIAAIGGRVVEIGVFSTVVDMPDGTRAYAPNSLVFNGVIRNRTTLSWRRPEIRLKIASPADIAGVRRSVEDVVATQSGLLPTPSPDIRIVDEPAGAVVLALRVATSIADEERVRWELTKRLREALPEQGFALMP